MCIKRDEMPQIDWADYPELFAFLNDNGVTVSYKHIPAKSLQPVQCRDEIRPTRNPAQYHKPLLISLDLDILNGNHRWAGFCLDGADTLVPCFQLNAGYDESNNLLQAFPKSYRYGDGPQPYRM